MFAMNAHGEKHSLSKSRLPSFSAYIAHDKIVQENFKDMRMRHAQVASTLLHAPPHSNFTVLAQVKCREHARPCQTRAISRSENQSKRSVGNIIERSYNFKDVRICDICASGIHTLHAPPSLQLQPWRR